MNDHTTTFPRKVPRVDDPVARLDPITLAGDPERPAAGVQRDGSGLRARGVQPGDPRGAGPIRRHLPRHLRFPEVPINAGTFAPLHIADPEGTFLYARYPRPVSGCAAEVSQRIAEAVFNVLTPVIPDRIFGAPAGTSGNFALGGHDPERDRAYVMYVISGGGYGGSPAGDGISNGCSTIGISKSTAIEVFEQLYPVLFEEYALHEGSGGAGEQRGGFRLRYWIRLRRGTAKASFVMDHGRTGPLGALEGEDGGVNMVIVTRNGVPYHPPHRSKDQGIVLQPGDTVEVRTPGGGGYGPAVKRPPRSGRGRRTARVLHGRAGAGTLSGLPVAGDGRGRSTEPPSALRGEAGRVGTSFRDSAKAGSRRLRRTAGS